jgi:predicted  nucleic acid-binding Zn-ribbon protein
VQKYFEDCQALIEKITDEETGIEAYHQLAESVKDQIEETKKSADTHLSSITTALSSVQTHIQEMETAYESFAEINAKIEDKDTGLEAILANATETKDEIVAVKTTADTLYKEIRKFRDEAANYIKEIGGLKTTATSAVEEIKDQHKQSTDLKEKIEEIFNIGSQGVHSNYFVQRRNQLLWISIFWLVMFLIFLVATVILAINYILPVANVLKKPNASVGLEVFLIRFSIITPTLFGAFYSLSQFSHDRRLYEKYAFKAISTYSAESSVATLSRAIENHKSDDKDAKIIDFAVSTFENIYQMPVEPMHGKWIFKGGNKILDLTAEMNQSVGEIKKDVDKLADNLSSES